VRRQGPVKEPAPSQCKDCILFEPCGGMGEQAGLYACFDGCLDCFAKGRCTCDFICPFNYTTFLQRVSELDVLRKDLSHRFIPVNTAALPAYLPQLQSGLFFQNRLNATAVALDLRCVFAGTKGRRYGTIAYDQVSLRRRFNLREDCRIVGIGVAPDTDLERLWAAHRQPAILDTFANSGFTAVTAPNFSDFANYPRFHNTCNRIRMLRFCERLSARGVAVIPHLHAHADHDWNYWADFLREHHEVNSVCVEFQTGAKEVTVRDELIDRLHRMRDAIGRALHPVVVSSIESAALMRAHFPELTFVDSTVSAKTSRRHGYHATNDHAVAWKLYRMKANACMTALFDHNLAGYSAYVCRRLTQSPTRGIPENSSAAGPLQTNAAESTLPLLEFPLPSAS